MRISILSSNTKTIKPSRVSEAFLYKIDQDDIIVLSKVKNSNSYVQIAEIAKELGIEVEYQDDPQSFVQGSLVFYEDICELHVYEKN